jgi:ABC-2 type transport system permease protein
VNALISSTRAELLRLRKWPALWVIVSVWLVLNVTFGYVFSYITYATGDVTAVGEGVPPQQLLADMMPAAVPESLVAGMPMFGGAIMLIFGGLAVGNGYGWGAWKTVFTQGPGRLSSFGGTLVALGVIVTGTVVATFAVDLGVSVLIASVESQTIVWPTAAGSAEAIGAGLLILGMWTTAGVLVGTLARSPALAVGLGLVWALVVENLLRGVAGMLGPVEAVTDLMPGTAAGSLAGALGVATQDDGNGTPGVLTVLDAAPAGWLLSAYVVVFAGIALMFVRRRDVT